MSEKEIKLALEEKYKDVPDTEQPGEEPLLELPAEAPQVAYGVHILMMDNGKPHVEFTGDPSYTQVLRMIEEVANNMRAELVAERVVAKLRQAQAKPKIIGRTS